jgi:hypothetical protein
MSRSTNHERDLNHGDMQSPNHAHAETHAPESAVDSLKPSESEMEGRQGRTLDRGRSMATSHASTGPSRSNSRVRNFAEGVGEYFKSKPGRRGLSRRASKESLNSHRSPDEPRPSTSSGWRNWGRSDSTQDMSPIDRFHSPEDQHSRDLMKSEVNLNRALPPLPGLDQWDANQKTGKDSKSIARTRIAPSVKSAPENDIIQDAIDAIDEEPEVEDIQFRRTEMRDSAISGAMKNGHTFYDSSNRSSLVSPVFTHADHSSHFVSTPATDGASPRSRTPHPGTNSDVAPPGKAHVSSHRRQISDSSVDAQTFNRKFSTDLPRSHFADSKNHVRLRSNSGDKKGFKNKISGWFAKKGSH